MIYSETHAAFYSNMITEMLQHAGFQESVNDQLRAFAVCRGLDAYQARVTDDLYQIYADQQVLDD